MDLFKKIWVVLGDQSLSWYWIYGLCGALLLLIGFLIRKGWAMRSFFSKSDPFQMKLSAILCCFVIIPCSLIAISSIVFLKRGLEVWFQNRVRTALVESKEVANAYVQEHTKNLQNTIHVMAKNLEQYLSEMAHAPNAFEPIPFILSLQNKFSDYLNCYDLTPLSFKAGIFTPDSFFGIQKVHLLAHSPLSVSLNFKLLSPSDLEEADKKESYLILDLQKNEVLAITRIFKNFFGNSPKFYLMLSCPLDENVVRKVRLTTEAVDAYNGLFELQKKLVGGFTVFFVLLTLLFILVAMALSMHFARLILNPVTALVQAARKLSRGESTLICYADMPSAKELRSLMSTFNAMSQEVYEKKKELEQANHDLQTRTLFVQSVLAGVSSGVLRVRETGEILLANPRAQQLLGEAFEGLALSQFFPEFMPLLQKAFQDPHGHVVQEDMTILRASKPATFRIYVKVLDLEKDAVVTWDDVSELIIAQKKNAWTDVARRIAHEVKNPLTPILLSAERLRRRYLSSIAHPEIFQDCIETIQCQVRHIGDLINEFLTFARMPHPTLSPLDMNALIQRHIIFQKEAYPEINFSYHSQGKVMVLGDVRQIEQVLINVFKNAIEAIQEQFPKEEKNGKIHVALCRQGPDILMTLSDNGAGLSIDKALLLCEPYMTTKAEGTGLGLAIVQKILHAHQGQFSLQPNPTGQGACAILCLKAMCHEISKK